MKYTALTIILLITLLSIKQSNAQDIVPSSTLQTPEEVIFIVVEQMPRFPGCEDIEGTQKDKNKCAKSKLLEYIYKNLKYPKEARKNKTEGTSVLHFNVWKDGTIRDIRIVRNPGDGTGEEAARVIASMMDLEERWTPGHQRGRPVTVQYTIPIKFKL